MTSDEETAERMLQDATQKQPVEPLAFYYLSDAAERLGHFQEARQALLDFDVLRGDEADARRRLTMAVRLGDLSIKLNEPATAMDYFVRAAAEPAADSTVLARLADAQWRSGDKAAARATVLRALERQPSDQALLTLRRRYAS